MRPISVILGGNAFTEFDTIYMMDKMLKAPNHVDLVNPVHRLIER